MLDNIINSTSGVGLSDYARFDAVHLSGSLALVLAALILLGLATRSLWLRIPAAFGALLILVTSVVSPLTVESVQVVRPLYVFALVMAGLAGAAWMVYDLTTPVRERLYAKWDRQLEEGSR